MPWVIKIVKINRQTICRECLFVYIKGLLTDKSDAIGSCNLKPNDNDNENDDNLSSN